ncbi:hypothetical protein IAU59_005114 [Kwoniella sp. CBS 9459]
MSAPPLQGYMENGNMNNNMNGVGIGQAQADPNQPIAGPSNYARQTQQQIPLQQLQQPFYGVNGHMPQYATAQPTFAPPAQQNVQAFMAPYTPGLPQFHAPQMMQYPPYDPNPAGVMPNFHFGTVSQPAWQDDWAEDMPHDGQEMIYSNLEVKHRRRTTPDQLKILEYWYDINPKPDNALREHLAAQLGMTKRNVQVWFQNRRAKMKGLAKKEEKAAEGGEGGGNAGQAQNQTPEKAQTVSPVHPPTQHRQVLLPPMAPPSMTRRASLANGEAAKIEMFVAKRAAAASGQMARNAGLRAPGFVSPQRSPLLGTANAARRQSIPYPTPITAGPAGASMSPKFSPVARVMPSALHLTAMRNNTRRASMPGAAQLISSGPFTPPRVVTNQHQIGNARGTRELSPIKDHDSDGSHQFLLDPESEFNATYITPPSSVHLPTDVSPISFLPTGSTGYDPSIPFSPDSPLPNPAFTFGGADMAQQLLLQQQQQPQVLDEAEAARQQQLFLAFQQRGRMGSIASINTLGTDIGNGTDLDEANMSEWSLAGQDLPNGYGQDGQGLPDGFDPDVRRSSAPADLLHQINLMGLNNLNPSPIRPSPLGTHFTSDEFHHGTTFDPNAYLTPTDAPASSDLSPMGSSSLGSSEGPSPTQAQSNYSQQMQQQYQHQHQQQQQQQQHLAPGQIIRSASLQASPGQMHAHVQGHGQGQGSISGGQHSASVSPYSEHSNPAHSQNQNQNQNQTYGQQAYQTAMYDGYQAPITGIAHPSNQTQGQGQGHQTPYTQQQQQQQQHQQQHGTNSASSGSGSGAGSGDSLGKDDFAFLNDLAGGNDAVNILV